MKELKQLVQPTQLPSSQQNGEDDDKRRRRRDLTSGSGSGPCPIYREGGCKPAADMNDSEDGHFTVEDCYNKCKDKLGCTGKNMISIWLVI